MALRGGIWLAPLLLALSCDDGRKETSGQAPRSGIALTVNGVPVEREEVERLAGFLTTYFYNMGFEEACGIVLVNSLIPRAASLAHFGAEAIEKQRRRIQEASRRIEAGEDFYAVGEEISDLPLRSDLSELEWGALAKLDCLLGEWLFSLPAGGTSKPILTRHGWYVIKAIEHKIPTSRWRASGRMHAIVCAFDTDPEFERKIQGWVDEAEIRIVDPAYDKILPEWMKYRAGARTWRPVEISPERAGNSSVTK